MLQTFISNAQQFLDIFIIILTQAACHAAQGSDWNILRVSSASLITLAMLALYRGLFCNNKH